MTKSLGGRLRQQREEQQIDLGTIADETKIKLSLLEALERDDVSQWPAGIFRRAFVRAYAHAIGLDPDVVVREFLETYPEPVEDIATSPAPADAETGRSERGPRTRLRYIVGSAIDALSRRRRRLAQPSSEPSRVETSTAVVADSPPAIRPASFEPDFLAVARLCTEFGRAEKTSDVQRLLREAAAMLDAVGLIVWVWDGVVEELRPALAFGYSDKVLAQLPTVKRDADNPTAAAFRSAHTHGINGSLQARGALVAPLLTPTGCKGVFAIELKNGSEQARSVRAAVTIVAAQLSHLMGSVMLAEARPQSDMTIRPADDVSTGTRRASG